jgi:hypothetical protein
MGNVPEVISSISAPIELAKFECGFSLRPGERRGIDNHFLAGAGAILKRRLCGNRRPLFGGTLRISRGFNRRRRVCLASFFEILVDQILGIGPDRPRLSPMLQSASR